MTMRRRMNCCMRSCTGSGRSTWRWSTLPKRGAGSTKKWRRSKSAGPKPRRRPKPGPTAPICTRGEADGTQGYYPTK